MKRLILMTLAVMAAVPARAADDPLLRPIAPDFAARWLGAEPPVRVYGNSYIVGFSGLTVGLIRTSAGLILIDGAVPQGVKAVEANIRRLGFRIQDVKLILSTEPHYDHAGGLAALARDSGATVVASRDGAAVLRTGHAGPDDPQAPILAAFPPVTRLRVVRDGEVIRLGDVAVTAHATPGHTSGSMSWTWASCAGGRCLNMVFGSSLNPVSGDGYRYSDPANAAVVASFRHSFDVVRGLPCDVLLSAHPDQSGADQRFARRAFVDPGACRAYADRFAKALDDRLAGER